MKAINKSVRTIYLTNKEAWAVYYTVITHNGHLRTGGKCRKHELQAFQDHAFDSVRLSGTMIIFSLLLDFLGVSYRIPRKNKNAVCHLQISA